MNSNEQRGNDEAVEPQVDAQQAPEMNSNNTEPREAPIWGAPTPPKSDDEAKPTVEGAKPTSEEAKPTAESEPTPDVEAPKAPIAPPVDSDSLWAIMNRAATERTHTTHGL